MIWLTRTNNTNAKTHGDQTLNTIINTQHHPTKENRQQSRMKILSILDHQIIRHGITRWNPPRTASVVLDQHSLSLPVTPNINHTNHNTNGGLQDRALLESGIHQMLSCIEIPPCLVQVSTRRISPPINVDAERVTKTHGPNSQASKGSQGGNILEARANGDRWFPAPHGQDDHRHQQQPHRQQPKQHFRPWIQGYQRYDHKSHFNWLICQDTDLHLPPRRWWKAAGSYLGKTAFWIKGNQWRRCSCWWTPAAEWRLLTLKYTKECTVRVRMVN